MSGVLRFYPSCAFEFYMSRLFSFHTARGNGRNVSFCASKSWCFCDHLTVFVEEYKIADNNYCRPPRRNHPRDDPLQKRLAFEPYSLTTRPPLVPRHCNSPPARAAVSMAITAPTTTIPVAIIAASAPRSAPTIAERVTSPALQELRRCTREMARQAIQKLTQGYIARSKITISPATTNSKGCVLAQKSTQRIDNGYVQIPPEGLRPVGEKTIAQGAHRLAVLAEHSTASVATLLNVEGSQASHLCHEPTCINHQHIVVETKAENEARKLCRSRIVVRTTIAGRRFELPSAVCPHKPSCIAAVEERVAIDMGKALPH